MAAGEGAAAAVRGNLRQVRRLLGAKEWMEASHEASRMADGLAYLEKLANRPSTEARPPSR